MLYVLLISISTTASNFKSHYIPPHPPPLHSMLYIPPLYTLRPTTISYTYPTTSTAHPPPQAIIPHYTPPHTLHPPPQYIPTPLHPTAHPPPTTPIYTYRTTPHRTSTAPPPQYIHTHTYQLTIHPICTTQPRTHTTNPPSLHCKIIGNKQYLL